MTKRGIGYIQRHLKSIETLKIGNLGKILERCDRMRKKVHLELSLRKLKIFSKTKLKTRLISTSYLYTSIFINFVSVPSKPAFKNNHILLFLVEGKSVFQKSIVCGCKYFLGNRGVGTWGAKIASPSPIQSSICLFSCPISAMHP